MTVMIKQLKNSRFGKQLVCAKVKFTLQPISVCVELHDYRHSIRDVKCDSCKQATPKTRVQRELRKGDRPLSCSTCEVIRSKILQNRKEADTKIVHHVKSINSPPEPSAQSDSPETD